MRIIARRTLRVFWDQQRSAKQPLKSWYREASQAAWEGPDAIKRRYRHASLIKRNRVVFNIGGNKYRLVVQVNYVFQVIYVRFVGTHAEYDKVNAGEI